MVDNPKVPVVGTGQHSIVGGQSIGTGLLSSNGGQAVGTARSSHRYSDRRLAIGTGRCSSDGE